VFLLLRRHAAPAPLCHFRRTHTTAGRCSTISHRPTEFLAFQRRSHIQGFIKVWFLAANRDGFLSGLPEKGNVVVIIVENIHEIHWLTAGDPITKPSQRLPRGPPYKGIN
jgi:hypothetical protein